MDELKKISECIKEKKLTWTTSGNISKKFENGDIYISKSNTNINDMKNEDYCDINNDTERSKEYLMHLEIYNNTNAKYCIHISPFYTTMLSSSDMKIKKNLFVESTFLLKNLSIIGYYDPGSIELAKKVGEASFTSNVILLKNHGCVVFHNDLKILLETVEILEICCKMNILSEKIIEIKDCTYLHSDKYKKVGKLW